MTDRYYPSGLPSEPDVWKTTNQVQNQMQSFERSNFPPGTAVHLPGARDKFGFGNPSPLAHRLTKPNATLNNADIDHTDAIDDMVRSYRSPMATKSQSASMGFGMKKSSSVPALARSMTGTQRLSTPPEAVHSMEDDHFSYFVPKGQALEGSQKMNTHMMSKLHKTDRISFPFSGEGTGFRSQGSSSDWMPGGSYKNMPTTYRTSFAKPPHFRKSPLSGY